VSSYRQILKSSSILGGSQAIGVLLGMVSVKINAIYLGPEGTGLIGNYQNILGLVGCVATLGISTAAVREMTLAYSEGNYDEFSSVKKVMHCLLASLGLFGFIVMALLSEFLGNLTFGHSNYTNEIISLGVILLISNLTAGINAEFQSRREISKLAINGLISGLVCLPAAWLCYGFLGKRGIAPYLIIASIIGLIVAWLFALKSSKEQVDQSRDNVRAKDFFGLRRLHSEISTIKNRATARRIVTMGAALALTGVVGSITAWAVSSYITSNCGEWTNGLYRTAAMLSGFIVRFILNAMAGDYYPRLVSEISDPRKAGKIVSEQLDVGILLAMPCILLMVVFCPWLIRIFYTIDYIGAVPAMRWFLLGCFLQVVSWPYGFTLLAAGKNRLYVIVETVTILISCLLNIVLFNYIGVKGLGIAMVCLYIFYTTIIYIASRGILTSDKKLPLIRPFLGALLILFYNAMLGDSTDISILEWILGATGVLIGFYCVHKIDEKADLGILKKIKKTFSNTSRL